MFVQVRRGVDQTEGFQCAGFVGALLILRPQAAQLLVGMEEVTTDTDRQGA